MDMLDGYRNAFTSHPARLTLIRDFLAPHVAERLSRFLESEAQFAPEYGLYSVEGGVAEQEWLRADERDRFFRLRKLVSTAPQFTMSPNALTYLQFRKAFQRPEFKAFFETISDLSLGWSDDFGAHSMIEGDFLRPHSDDNRNRRLALVIYLSRGWQPSFGGQLRVLHKDGTSTEIEPQYNSMIAFDVLTAPAHVVLPITPAAGANQRLTIGGWYHNVA
jgi:Rps23 Pro-64 3,4-dihydroxylase Tpa1-like proline 4-hydroxylase